MSELTSASSVRITKAVWLVVAIGGTALWVFGPASQWAQLQTACHPTSACAQYQLDAASVRILSAHGISLVGYAAYTVAVLTMGWVIWYGLAAVIIWRKPDDRGALLAAFFLILFPLLEVVLWIPSVDFLAIVSLAALFIFGLLFPDGRFQPRWARWLLAPYAVSAILAPLLPSSGFWLPVFLAPIAAIGVQVYRFRSLSTWVQRQQTKW